MLTGYGYIGLFIVVAILFAASMVTLPIFLRRIGLVPRKPSPVKEATFECGLSTIGRSWVQFNFRYYFFALMFVALDVLVLFIYPWAVSLRQLGFFGLIALLVLLFVILVVYVYAWRKKVLEWK